LIFSPFENCQIFSCSLCREYLPNKTHLVFICLSIRNWLLQITMRSFSQVKGAQEWKAYKHSFWAWKGNHRTKHIRKVPQRISETYLVLSRDLRYLGQIINSEEISRKINHTSFHNPLRILWQYFSSFFFFCWSKLQLSTWFSPDHISSPFSDVSMIKPQLFSHPNLGGFFFWCTFSYSLSCFFDFTSCEINGKAESLS